MRHEDGESTCVIELLCIPSPADTRPGAEITETSPLIDTLPTIEALEFIRTLLPFINLLLDDAGGTITVRHGLSDEEMDRICDEEWSRAKSIRVIPDVPQLLHDAFLTISASGVTVGAMKLLKMWADARNGRKLKIKIGDIEVEATQMNEKDVLRIFELLEEKADRKKIRELLLAANQMKDPRPSKLM